MAWGKVWTAFKGMVSETGEEIADNQALRILDQEIREADAELKQAKTDLTGIIAKRKGEERRVQELTQKIGEYENYAMAAMQKGDETLATEIAGRIADLESDQQTHQTLLEEFSGSEQKLRQSLKTAEVNLKRLKQQADVVKATQSVQSAQAGISGRFHGSNTKMTGALDSLERIKKRQSETADRLKASQEMEEVETGDDLERKMKEAGITGSAGANSVLERLKARSATTAA